MAERKAAEDEFNPRHRIVGAVILVALAVIFLPMLLSDRPPETESPSLTDTPVPETRIVVAPVPLPGATPGKGEPAAKPAVPDKGAPKPTIVTKSVPVESPNDSALAAMPPAKPPAPVAATRPTPEPRPAAEPKAAKAPPKAAAGAKGWVVQVGVFSHPENARRLQDKLRQKGYAVQLDPPHPTPGKTVRVEVGPYKDAAAARAAQARIQGDVGIKGVVRTQ
jgi:DedD protein